MFHKPSTDLTALEKIQQPESPVNFPGTNTLDDINNNDLPHILTKKISDGLEIDQILNQLPSIDHIIKQLPMSPQTQASSIESFTPEQLQKIETFALCSSTSHDDLYEDIFLLCEFGFKPDQIVDIVCLYRKSNLNGIKETVTELKELGFSAEQVMQMIRANGPILMKAIKNNFDLFKSLALRADQIMDIIADPVFVKDISMQMKAQHDAKTSFESMTFKWSQTIPVVDKKKKIPFDAANPEHIEKGLKFVNKENTQCLLTGTAKTKRYEAKNLKKELFSLGYKKNHIEKILFKNYSQAIEVLKRVHSFLLSQDFNRDQIIEMAIAENGKFNLNAVANNTIELKKLGIGIEQIKIIACLPDGHKILDAIKNASSVLQEFRFSANKILDLAFRHDSAKILGAIKNASTDLHVLGFNVDQIVALASLPESHKIIDAVKNNIDELKLFDFKPDQIIELTMFPGYSMNLDSIKREYDLFLPVFATNGVPGIIKMMRDLFELDKNITTAPATTIEKENVFSPKNKRKSIDNSLSTFSILGKTTKRQGSTTKSQVKEPLRHCENLNK